MGRTFRPIISGAAFLGILFAVGLIAVGCNGCNNTEKKADKLPQLKFSGPVLADIYLQKIKKWNDPAIQKLNPDVKLPDLDILVVHRSDGSGTTYIYVDYLSKISAEWKEKV